MINQLNIIKWLEKVMQPVRDWIFKNHSNPLLWLTLFVLGILIFAVVFRSLQKEK